MNFSINICGFGFVGGSIGHVLEKNNIHYNVYDVIKPNKTGTYNYYDDINNMINESEKEEGTFTNIYFISVPTPSDDEGNCDTSIVEKVVNDLSTCIKRKSIILIKSTVKPGTIRKLYEKYHNDLVDIVFCPEFLRELTANDDMYNANFSLFGNHSGKDDDTIEKLVNLFTNYMYRHKKVTFYKRFLSQKGGFKCYTRTFEEMELFKYTINTFLAVKVWYFNEIYEICNKFNIDYQSFKTLFPLEPRIGKYGTTVPGDDGRGFSKKCLPKECRGMRGLQNELNIPNNVLDEILTRNNYFRSLE
jgi:UDPglucose 6-dehydrogenase